MRPYNLSIFEIRKHYRSVFPEDEFKVKEYKEDESRDSKAQMFRIEYNINLLPSIGTYFKVNRENEYIEIKKEETYLPAILADSNELSHFSSPQIIDLIDYKWNMYGFRFHLLGTVVHLSYLVVLFIYNYWVYVRG